MSEEKGAALVTVVWAVLLLAILSTGLLYLGLTARQSSLQLEQAKRNRFVAESAMDIMLSRYFFAGDDGIVREGAIDVLGQSVDFKIEYERGRINLNRANVEYLSAVFASKGVSENMALELASRIIDWRDRDDEPLILGAEAEDYHAESLEYGPRNGPFESVGELQSVLGMTPNLFYCVSHLFTVASLIPTVDVRYASPEVLEVLRWAYTSSWQGFPWDDPDEDLENASAESGSEDLSGWALRISVEPNEQVGEAFEALLRATGTSGSQYTVIRPLHSKTTYSSDQFCDAFLAQS